MRVATVAVCVLVLTAGCVGNGGIPADIDETERSTAEPEPTPQQPATPSSAKYDVEVERIEYLFHEKMNDRREENGLEPLARNETLDAVARYKSWDMAQRDYFAHTGPDGTKVGINYMESPMECAAIGENLHKAEYTEGETQIEVKLPRSNQIASDAVNSLLNSSGHRQNALSPHYDSQGIGVFVDENGTVFVTQELCG